MKLDVVLKRLVKDSLAVKLRIPDPVDVGLVKGREPIGRKRPSFDDWARWWIDSLVVR